MVAFEPETADGEEAVCGKSADKSDLRSLSRRGIIIQADFRKQPGGVVQYTGQVPELPRFASAEARGRG